jgi:hypothetical protein
MNNTGCEEWIKNVLIPGMVQRNDFDISENADSYEIDELNVAVLPADGTFMLTKPYKIKLSLVDRERDVVKTYNLIAKVCKVVLIQTLPVLKKIYRRRSISCKIDKKKLFMI